MIYNDNLPPYINDLVNARKNMRLTQRELAEKAGVSYSTITKLERNAHNPSGNCLASVCDALGLIIRLVQPTS